MNTPKTVLIEFLARRDKLNMKDWIYLIESRVGTLKPFFRDISLKRLGDLQIRDRWHSQRKINFRVVGQIRDRCRNASVKKFDDELFLHLQSMDVTEIWSKDGNDYLFPSHTEEISPTDIKNHYWGLSRNKKWIHLEIHLKEELGKIRIEEIIVSHIDSLDELMKVSRADPKDIWEMLSNEVNRWVKKKEEKYLEASEIRDTLRTEDFISRKKC